MNIFDFQIVTFINQFSQHSWIFDKLIGFLSHNNLFKGGVLATIIWWAWFKSEDRHSHNREHIISTLLSCIIAIALARAFALTLPFRLRPLQEEGLHFLLPFGMTTTVLEGWSSFPSDHAVLFIALSTGLLFVSRWVGTFSLSYTVLFIGFPRVYLGLHYPTDIIAGAIIGMTIALLGNIYLVQSTLIQSITNWSYSKPNLFYPLFFLLTYQIVELFDHSRSLVSAVIKLIRNIIA
jgi:undecaprenyl-diphosphatase